MEVKIKLSSGKKLKLTGEELKELLDFKSQQFYCIVYHYWFQDSKHFMTEYLKADNIREARKEALLVKEKTEGTFNKCAFEIVEVFRNDNI
jgi:hypothetical protein